MAAAKTMTLTALKNIPLAMCGEVPAKLAKHPGGARVERGTSITVDVAVGKRLKDLNYAK